MTDHLTHDLMNALVDGELTSAQLADANQHLASCPSCTSYALHQSLLKSATAKAGQRYQPPPDLKERLARLTAREDSQLQARVSSPSQGSSPRRTWGYGSVGWAAAAVLLVASASMILIQRAAQRNETATVERAALVTEVFDQHVATLAGNLTPQVVSTDRHTVKPWFQGKIPFSFNLPQSLPSDTMLEGANLNYLRNQPVAQLLFSIGKHRVSVFLRQKSGSAEGNEWANEQSGFHVREFSTNDLEIVAVSDVDPARLAELLTAIKTAQTGEPQQSK
jgi:anti-sigma factor RsiW